MSSRAGVALVTGAAGGIGRLAAQRLAAAGRVVVAVDVDRVGLERTARRAPQIRPHVLDVRDAAAVEDLVAGTEEHLGTIERLVHAAGVATAGRVTEQPLEELQRTMGVDYGGLVTVIRSVVARMVERDRGEVVLVGSLAGWIPVPGLAACSAAGAAVVAFAEALALELAGSSVRVVCVCPPLVDTPGVEQVRERGPAWVERLPRVAPEVVLDTAERALEEGRVVALPGRGTAALWRLRRFAPGVLRRRIAALERSGVGPGARRPRVLRTSRTWLRW